MKNNSFTIQEMIRQSLLADQDKTIQNRRTDKFNVSDSGQCHRKRILKRLIGQKKIDDDRLLRIFQVGHIFHDWLQKLLERNGFMVEYETKLEDDHFIGHFDGLVKDKEGKYYLIDFKTVHSRKFKYLKDNPDQHHLKQLSKYLEMFKKERDIEIEGIIIVYVSKDDLLIKEFFFKPEEVENINTDDNILVEYFEKGIIPPAEPMNDWECQYCQYFEECQKIGKDKTSFEVLKNVKK